MNKILKVLHITTSYPKFEGDTSGIFVKHLVDALKKNGVHCEVLTSSSDSPDDFRKERINTFRYAPWKWQCLCHNPGGIPACIRKKPFTLCLLPSFLVNMYISTIRKSRNVHLIHCHWSISGAIACLGKKIHKKKVITTLRGSDHYLSRDNPYRYLHKIAIRESDAVVTVSKSILNDICETYPQKKDRFWFIPNGIGEDFLNIDNSSKPFPPPFTFLYTGSLIGIKGLDTVLKALALLKDINFKFKIVGDGDLREYLDKLARQLEIRDRIDFLGILPNDMIPELLKNCHLFILASHREGRSNSLLEAMASAVPVIASDIEANRELIFNGKNGILFPAGDYNALSEKIRDFCMNYSRYKDIGLSGRDHLLKIGLNWDSCAMNYIELYKKVLGQ